MQQPINQADKLQDSVEKSYSFANDDEVLLSRSASIKKRIVDNNEPWTFKDPSEFEPITMRQVERSPDPLNEEDVSLTPNTMIDTTKADFSCPPLIRD